MFYFSDNRDKCRKPGFLRGNLYTSCISMVLLDHSANKSNTFKMISPSLALPFPPWVATSSYLSYQDTAIKGTLNIIIITINIISVCHKGLWSLPSPNCIERPFSSKCAVSDQLQRPTKFGASSLSLSPLSLCFLSSYLPYPCLSYLCLLHSCLLAHCNR